MRFSGSPRTPAAEGGLERDEGEETARALPGRNDGPAITTNPIGWRPRLSLPGAWGGFIFLCASLTPSLLPRGAVTQGVVSGISAAIGYGVGVVAAWGWRALTGCAARQPSTRAWPSYGIVATLVGVAALVQGRRWQQRLLELMGAQGRLSWYLVVVPLVALAVGALLLAASRGVRLVARRVSRWLSRWLAPRAAAVIGGLIVAALFMLALTGVLLDAALSAADSVFSIRDTTTAEGIEPPNRETRSGGPGSLIAWETLGRQGRSFVADGPTRDEIAELVGSDAVDPIRVYAGIASAEDLEERAQLAVDELVRAGGFEREYLLVATTTGTGWLDPGTMSSFDHLTRGDSAVVTLQYSYLPSWLSYLVDQSRARAAGRELFDAVYERWVELPETARPQLFVFGESLGSFGAETAFSGEFDLRNRTDGALFVGPPNFNPLHREFTDGRDAGSTQVEPVYRSGRTVRFSNEIGAGAQPAGEPWDGPRVLYLQHPSDPIVWWTPQLLLRRPDWLAEARGRDVLDQMVWIPFVTFWQVTLDLPFAVDTPDGHGHRYTAESVDAWRAVLRPEGWDHDLAARLRESQGP